MGDVLIDDKSPDYKVIEMLIEEGNTLDNSDEEYVDEHESNKKLASEEIIQAPEVGMTFESLDYLFGYYKQYGKQEGFGVKKRSTRSFGDLTFVCLSCCRAGNSKSVKQNYLIPNPLTKMGSKAKVNASVFKDGKCKINSIILEHNHGLSPQKSRFYSCNREISMGAKRKLELNDRAGIGLAKNYQSFVMEAGGHDSVSFLEKDCRNYIDKKRKLRLGVGDALAIHNYFVRMQAKNSKFFYMMDVDDNARIRNLFWADARSVAAYEEFGDVVTFDTTYLTNKYDMPFAPFVGVNHHGHSILFGCGLLSSEDTNTFTWLFRTWLACMSGRAPCAIITDQDKAMQKAIEVVFPNTRHRWCLWHIMKKIPEKLRGYKLYEKIKSVLHSVVYESLEKEEFEEKWEQFITEFNLHENVWLDNLYKERDRWVPTFVKDTFWAGMSTTQRSESMNAFFDGYVNSKTTLKQFVEQYDNALRSKAEKENREDFQSFTTWIPCVTHFQIEKQFQSVYTNSKFKEFQRELTGKLYCEVSCVDEENGLFNVIEDILVGDKQKKLQFIVFCDKGGNEVKCPCRLFEYRGILCKHALSVLLKRNIQKVPELYILARWRKDLKRSHTKVKVTYDDWKDDEEAQRYHKLQKKLDDVADLAVTTDENCTILLNMMDEFQSKIKRTESALKSSSISTNATMSNIDCCDNVGDFCKAPSESRLHSPLAVRRHGRPPKNRRVSNVEKFVSKKKKCEEKKSKKKKEKLESKATEQEDCMHIEVGTQDSTSIQEPGTQAYIPYNFQVNEMARFQQHIPYFHHLPTYVSRPPILPNSILNAQGPAMHYYDPYMRNEENSNVCNFDSGNGNLPLI